jgi:hypothetical protein
MRLTAQPVRRRQRALWLGWLVALVGLGIGLRLLAPVSSQADRPHGPLSLGPKASLLFQARASR